MNFKIFATGCLLLVFAVLASGSALSFISPSYQPACKCDPLTFKMQLVADEAENFALSANTQLSSFITPSINALAGSTNTFDLIITSPCDTIPGNYSFLVSAQGSKGHNFQLIGNVGVRECSQLKLIAPPQQVLCGGDQTQFIISLQNKGVFDENGTLYTDLPSSIYTLSDNKFDLAPGRSKQFVLMVSIPLNAPPATIPFKVTASSQYSYREIFSTLTIGGSQCSALTILLPSFVDAQVNQQTTVQAKFTNVGSDDSFVPSFSCSVPFTFDTSAFSLVQGGSTTRNIVFTPSQDQVNKDFVCSLTARSQKYGTQFNAGTTVRVRQFYSASIQSLSGNSVESCRGDSKTASFKLSNAGRASAFTLSASSGTLSTSSLNVGANASAEFTLAIDTIAAGEKTITVAASNTVGVTASIQIKSVVRECFATQVLASSQSLLLCPGQKNSTTFTVFNKGSRDDSFAYSASSQLQTQLNKPSGSIKAGSSDSVLLVVSAPENTAYSKEYQVSFQAKGKTTASATINVKTLDEEYCRNLVLSITPQQPAHQVTASVKNSRIACEECSSESFEIELENKGAFDEELSLSIEGQSWAYINPSSLSLAKSVKKSVFVYIAPPMGTKAGEYSFKLVARGMRGVFAEAPLKAVIFAAGTKPIESTPSPVATAEVSPEPSTEVSPPAEPTESSQVTGLFTAGNTVSALILAILAGLVALWLILGRDKPAQAGESSGKKEQDAEEKPAEKEEKSEKHGKAKKK